MPCPFPGMDPYLEDPAFWPDFHDRFIVYWSDALNDVLPEDYEARVNERTRLIDLTANEETLPRPDVAIDRGGPGGSLRAEARGVATLEPVTIPLRYLEEARETYIEIRRGPERTVVAMLELLSPSNKSGSDRVVYLQKREAILRQDVHLVELDLLKDGHRVSLKKPLPVGDYYYFVYHGDRRPDCDVYAWTVRDPLPKLPVPLMAPDSDLVLDFAPILETAYQRGRYTRALAYNAPPPGPWPDEERAWIMEQARSGR